MALIKCPECNAKISSTVSRCPKCGMEITQEIVETITMDNEAKKKNRNKYLIAIACVIVIAIAVFASVQIYNYNKKLSEEKARIDGVKIFSEDVSLYIENSSEYLDIEKKMVTFKDEIWVNSISKEDDDETDLFTKDQDVKFYDDFNDALKDYYNSNDYTSSAAKRSDALELETSAYNKVVNSPYASKEILDIVKNIHETILGVDRYDNDYGYSITDYEAKTKECFIDITDNIVKLEALQPEITSKK